jgi:hypothetical protein
MSKRPIDPVVAAREAGRFAGKDSDTHPGANRQGNPHQARAPPEHAAPGDDLLWGARAVADFLGVSVDRVYYLVRMKRLPIAKLGRKTIVASRKKLQRAIADTLAA